MKFSLLISILMSLPVFGADYTCQKEDQSFSVTVLNIRPLQADVEQDGKTTRCDIPPTGVLGRLSLLCKTSRGRIDNILIDKKALTAKIVHWNEITEKGFTCQKGGSDETTPATGFQYLGQTNVDTKDDMFTVMSNAYPLAILESEKNANKKGLYEFYFNVWKSNASIPAANEHKKMVDLIERFHKEVNKDSSDKLESVQVYRSGTNSLSTHAYVENWILVLGYEFWSEKSKKETPLSSSEIAEPIQYPELYDVSIYDLKFADSGNKKKAGFCRGWIVISRETKELIFGEVCTNKEFPAVME